MLRSVPQCIGASAAAPTNIADPAAINGTCLPFFLSAAQLHLTKPDLALFTRSSHMLIQQSGMRRWAAGLAPGATERTPLVHCAIHAALAAYAAPFPFISLFCPLNVAPRLVLSLI